MRTSPARRRLALLLAGLGALSSGPARAEDVLLISVDGLMPAYHREADRLGLRIPHLRRLMREGTQARGVVGVTPSVTFPSHATMITGVWPSTHGVANNRVFDPDGRLGGGWYWYYEDLRVPTLFDLSRAAGFRTAAVTWPVTAGGPIDDNLPDMYPVENLREAKNLVALAAEEGLADVLPPAAQLVDLADGIRTDVALSFLDRRPAFMAVHYLELDTAQHRHGPLSGPAREALERIDGEIGRLFARLEEQGRWNGTNVVLVSDHGFLPVHTAVHIGVLLRDRGLVELDRKGGVARWDATVWAAGGSAAIFVREGADPGTKVRVDDALDSLERDPAYGVRRVWRGRGVAGRRGFSGAYAIVDAQAGFWFSGTFDAPAVTEPAPLLGAHGHDPARLPLRAALILRGPAVRAGHRIGTVRLVDIGPTVAHLLGLRFEHTDGRVLREALRRARG